MFKNRTFLYTSNKTCIEKRGFVYMLALRAGDAVMIEIYEGLAWRGQVSFPDFQPPNQAELALRQAAHDAVEITELKRANEILTNAAQLGLSSAAVRINETVEAMRQPQREELCHNPD